jgi:predicted NBD/HSP70 family sugar kinase
VTHADAHGAERVDGAGVRSAGRDILAVDVGGSAVKALLNGERDPRRFTSGPDLTPAAMVARLFELTRGWSYELISLGVPAPVARCRVVAEPKNLGGGWVGFDFEAAFGRPTRVVNDAAMQALGSYEGGRMLFLGLGTNLGSAIVDHGRLEPMELHSRAFRDGTYEDYVGQRALDRLGLERWRRCVSEAVVELAASLRPDYVILGGGNVRLIEELPEGARRGDNAAAFLGGFRLWEDAARS